MSKKVEEERVEKEIENSDRDDDDDEEISNDDEKEKEKKLTYNGISKKMEKTPYDYKELLNIFVEAFGEDKDQKFDFFYIDKKNNNKLEKLKEDFLVSDIYDVDEFKIIKKEENKIIEVENNDNKEKKEEPISTPSSSMISIKKDENIDSEEQKKLIQKLEKELEDTRIKFNQCLEKNKELKTKKNNLEEEINKLDEELSKNNEQINQIK